MGAIHNKLRGPNARPATRIGFLRGSRLGGSAALLSALLLIPAASVADPIPAQTDPAAKTAETATGPAARDLANPVSMSPTLVGMRPNTTTPLTPLEGDQTSRPLTRAAAQLRVETMSPADWLAGFGNVTVGRIDTSGLE